METGKLEQEMKVTLEEAKLSDIPALIELERKVDGSRIYSPMITEEEWQEEINNNKVFLIKAGGKVAGNFSYEIKSPDHIYISGLVVDPSFQGKGIGRKVLEKFLQQTKDVGRIDLVTHPENTNAIKLYESFGFKVETQIENYFNDGEPRVIMALQN